MPRIILAIVSLAVTLIGGFFLSAFVMITTGYYAPRDYIFVLDQAVPDREFWLVSRRGVEKVPLKWGSPFVLSGDGRGGGHRIAHLVAAPTGRVREKIVAAYDGVPGLFFEAQSEKLPEGFSRSRQMDFYGSLNFYDSRYRVTECYTVDLKSDGEITLTLQSADKGSLGRKIAWAVIIVSFLAACWWLFYRILNGVLKAFWPVRPPEGATNTGDDTCPAP